METALSAKLLMVQKELKAPKGQFNAFGKYKYRSCEDILEAVKPICHKNEIVLMVSDTLENIGDRYYIKAMATITDGKDTLTVHAYAREEETKKGMDGAQITGAASSYARKYALNGLFCIDDTKDADATNDGSTAFITKAQAKEINDLVIETNSDPAKFIAYMGVSTYDEIPSSNYKKAITALNAKKGN